ncbi:hypothetical protein JCM11641_001728 [Rhodosporidiobolus odoratus]
MDTLPVELLQCIGAELLIAWWDRGQSADPLARFMRTSKRMHRALKSLLYRFVESSSLRQIQRGLHWVNPCTIAINDENILSFQPGDRWLKFDSALHYGLLNRLTKLSISDFYLKSHFLATLLDPLSRIRGQLKRIELYAEDYFTAGPVMVYFLEGLHYLNLDESAAVLDVDHDSLAEAEPDWEERCKTTEYGSICRYNLYRDSPTLHFALLERAHTEYPSFLSIYDRDPTHSVSFITSMLADISATDPIENSPWSSLKYLQLQFADELELLLIFCTPSFPSLRELHIVSAMENFVFTPACILLLRRSVSR